MPLGQKVKVSIKHTLFQILVTGDDDDDGPSSKRAKSDSPSNMTPTPPGSAATTNSGIPGMTAGMMPPGMIGVPRAPFGMPG